MIINITTPKNLSYIQILLRTKRYYRLRGLPIIIENKEKNYYIFLKKKRIQIEITSLIDGTIDEIQQYLDCIFKDNYVGMQEKHAAMFKLEKARLINL